MSRPKGSAQFEGDVDKAVKEFLRNVPDEAFRETLEHAEQVLATACRDVAMKIEAVFCLTDDETPLQAVDKELRKIAELCEAPVGTRCAMPVGITEVSQYDATGIHSWGMT